MKAPCRIEGSSKQVPIPEYGIEKDVRVCLACYDRITGTGSVKPRTSSVEQQSNTFASSAPKVPQKTQSELEEEEAFQLALAISQSEAEDKEHQKKMLTQRYAMSSINNDVPLTSSSSVNISTPIVSAPLAEEDEEKDRFSHGELSKYLERSYWEQKHQALSSGIPLEDVSTTANVSQIKAPQLPDAMNNYVSDSEIDDFVNLVNDNINNIKFRMLSNQNRGRNITNDTAVQSVFLILQAFHPELHKYMKLLEDKRTYYESLQDKLGQLKDAREALNALRTEHYERKQREQYERERQRQIVMAQKLDVMRQKKQEYLEYQRQLHLQQLAEQELEMQKRLEQQRHYALMRDQQQNSHSIPTLLSNQQQTNKYDMATNQQPYMYQNAMHSSNSIIDTHVKKDREDYQSQFYGNSQPVYNVPSLSQELNSRYSTTTSE
ncbi:unnamed protein product [Didymodactylos carnosus]|uniref:Hepatocyte growth factor-regulated tyrosine kinase substrate helical domain-containing protein n=1 Tax=Didymodactylos carnosus TaxID=1234261 RepID=A0A8S2D184_9BILA|nr:unnamed protein product [Didymodactylos carnosus]CAF3560506.1 unnamed protein product [Didymodactylos carnosus]